MRDLAAFAGPCSRDCPRRSLGGCNWVPTSSSPIPICRITPRSPGQTVSDAQLPAPTDPNWWTAFGDPMLTNLESAHRRRQSRRADGDDPHRGKPFSARRHGRRRIAGDQRRRQISARAIQPERHRQPARPPARSGRHSGINVQPINEYTVGLDASWELDLWGRVRRQIEVCGRAGRIRPKTTRRDALVSSLAELARDYIQLRGAQAQIRIAEREREGRSRSPAARATAAAKGRTQRPRRGERGGAGRGVSGAAAEPGAAGDSRPERDRAVCSTCRRPRSTPSFSRGTRFQDAASRPPRRSLRARASATGHPRGGGSAACGHRQYRRRRRRVLSERSSSTARLSSDSLAIQQSVQIQFGAIHGRPQRDAADLRRRPAQKHAGTQ